MNDRRKKTEQLSIVMRQFLKFRFDSSMRYNMKIVPPNFDQNFAYCHACLFENTNYDDQEYCAEAWLTELFLDSQAHMSKLSKIEVFLMCFVQIFANLITQIVGVYIIAPDENKEWVFLEYSLTQ